jgi:hypothetical protein
VSALATASGPGRDGVQVEVHESPRPRLGRCGPLGGIPYQPVRVGPEIASVLVAAVAKPAVEHAGRDLRVELQPQRTPAAEQGPIKL